ncbi:unnamed protein product [Somion occarium]|uniref:Senataxin n=1 Tax=Somion occarium TaxID=3059160 RepID=A0ABP1E0L5_9APHY
MGGPTSNVEDIKSRLLSLRDNPANTQSASDEVLGLLYNFLLTDNTPEDRPFHWFCHKADELVVETATFLIRLHAYNSPRVDAWREQLRRCLFGCHACIQKFQEIKTTSRHTYFGAFADDVLTNFYQSLSVWELNSVLDGLAEANFRPGTPVQEDRTLSSAPSALVYHICASLFVLRDPRIMEILESYPPPKPYSDWPSDNPAPGLFLLMMARKSKLIQWATEQVQACKTTPIHSDHFLPMHAEALEEVSAIVATAPPSNESKATRLTSIPVTDDASILWSSYSTVLRFVPYEWLQSSAILKMDVRKVVIGHLSDIGTHFIHVLKSFALLLTRIGPALLEDEDSGFPVVIFDTVKDNPRFEDLIAGQSDSWCLEWIQPFVKAAGELPAFTDVFPIVIQCLCEQLQHERFKDVRPRAIDVACKTLHAVLFDPDVKGKPSCPETNAACACLDIHANMLVTVGFSNSKLYSGDAWKGARAGVRRLVRLALTKDTKDLAIAINTLARPPKDSPPPDPLTIRERIWTQLYKTIDPSDVEGISILLSILSRLSHTDMQNSVAYSDSLKQFSNLDSARKVLEQVNFAITIFRSGFSDAASRFQLNDMGTMLQLFGTKDVVQHLTMLMFSPMEDLREPAQNIVGITLDVDSRQDCFRELLQSHPCPTMAGILQFLKIFSEYAKIVPEACSVSKSLALCLTDIIDVMCSKDDGLLLQENFLKSLEIDTNSNSLLTWWNYMTKALTVIFSRTPRWAAYFNNAEMVLWMRDALIFGRDMLAQRKVIEMAASGYNPSEASSKGKKSMRIRERMVEDLQPVLLELTRWLRLTDEELLHQSFALLDTLLSCFLETATIKPSDVSFQKLRKFVADAQGSGPGRRGTLLDANRAKNLHEKLLQFEEDDEVQIIEHKLAPKSELAKHPSHAKTLRPERAGPSRLVTTLDTRPSTQKADIIPSTKTQTSQAARPTKSDFFSTEDQRKLDAASHTIPKFTSSIKPSAVLSGRLLSSKLSGPTKERRDSGTSSAAWTTSPSGSESDDEENTLESLARMQRTPKVKRQAERRGIKVMDFPTNARNSTMDRLNQRRQDDPRRAAKRLKPDISYLHRAVLSRDYEHAGPEPPGEKLSLLRVPDRFSDPGHYRNIFEPLLFVECWSQIQQSKEMNQDTFECRVSGRQYTDEWMDLELSLEEGVRKDWQLTDTDVVLLKHPEHKRGFLAKTQHVKSQPNQALQVTVRMIPNGPGPQVNSRWTVSKVFSLTTVLREYAALMALPYYDLCEAILRPNLTRQTASDQTEIQQTMASYNLNEPQAKAILAAMKTIGFSLIQGPPGTGKTSTICGLVHMFLSRRPKPATAVHVGRSAGPAEKEAPKKILLCAPSNAAIDEITYRLTQGISGAGRKSTVPKVVRVGAPQSMNVSVQDVALDTLVKAKLEANPEAKKQSSSANNEMNLLRAELGSIKDRRESIFTEIKNTHDNITRSSNLKAELSSINQRRAALTHKLDKLRDQEKSNNRSLDAIGRKYRAEVLRESDVICTTLSGAGHELLEPYEFEMVVIDEAAQAIELSSLIPMKYSCIRCVMVGDPQQLPPTVISQEASKFAYNQSLFVRLQKQRPDVVHLLSIQYRMHPEISRLPSRLFYDGRLIDGPDMATKTRKPWHTHPKFGVYRFYNVHRGQEETTSRRSQKNLTECQVAIALYNRLTREFSYDFDFKVGIVSMYKAQVDEMRRAFKSQFGESIKDLVDFNTVDGFQGQEKEIIILSCVRAGPGVSRVGFLSDIRRMNVALTRARSSLFILGHAATLERSDEYWRSIVADARERSCLYEAHNQSLDL